MKRQTTKQLMPDGRDFYKSPSPEEEAYVQVGDKVTMIQLYVS